MGEHEREMADTLPDALIALRTARTRIEVLEEALGKIRTCAKYHSAGTAVPWDSVFVVAERALAGEGDAGV